MIPDRKWIYTKDVTHISKQKSKRKLKYLNRINIRHPNLNGADKAVPGGRGGFVAFNLYIRR